MTTKTLANYLGKPASNILDDAPFRDWFYERTIETDLEKPRIDYVFAHDGIDFVCDGEDNVRSIFLYFDEVRCFDENLVDIPYLAPREQIVESLGAPSKSGGRIKDPVLGEYGAWDRFIRPGYAIHVEYRVDVDRLKKVTLMRADAVP